MVTSITIAGPKFSGKPGDWPDTKTEIVDAFNSAGAGFVNKDYSCHTELHSIPPPLRFGWVLGPLFRSKKKSR